MCVCVHIQIRTNIRKLCKRIKSVQIPLSGHDFLQRTLKQLPISVVGIPYCEP